MSERIWIIDDDPAIRYVLEEFFRSQHMPVRSFERGADLEDALSHHHPDLVMADVRLNGENGLELMQSLRERLPDLPVIVMTAYSDLDSAVQAFKGGALEFLAKPFDLDEVGRLVQKALAGANAEEGVKPGKDGLIGSSPAFQELIRMIGRLSASDIPVLITGETGTGKELIARALHKHSPRAEGPFIAINTAAIPEDLLESELFGHEKGAFTGASEQYRGRFEQAQGGTLFLDEIGDMPLTLQSRLLRVLAEGEYYRLGGRDLVRTNARIITATHRNLARRVEAGEFRADLYHRLKVINLAVPPLRERREDIPELARHFLRAAGKEFRLPPKLADRALLNHLKSLDWPGNVRELKHLCQSLAALAPAPLIGIDDLPPEYRRPGQAVGSIERHWTEHLADALYAELGSEHEELFEAYKREFEQAVVRTTLRHCDDNQSEAARRLGISRNTLARMLKEQ
ncbi:nitrogen regulation protein NR(I) [Wenzhouxiangella marina]|uniref:DNA-binding transcriptional regulator NtrC n=1 Tax=Wenzhouxiangella marina TaxID=1579979 RepID=A0A0K0XZM0_9GAMM|nr:nitrogen regulation protein NR(I) [Wenzhouxiangella marina]AKS43129.1 Nitrogen regulation protein NR(I) [Wenzhouxiangella marina]MBB6087186.1 two-component system nitrogen regulation response regulator GlnG [Wenzhouxiangella marina]